MPRRVLLTNTSDHGGGAEIVVRNLKQELARAGLLTHLVVADATNPGSLVIPNWEGRSSWARRLVVASGQLADLRGQMREVGALSRILRWLAEPIRHTRRRLGHEDFNFPGTAKLLDLIPAPVDLIHLHNLHGDYFDLTELRTISQQVPTAVTLHDQWLMTGHCAYSLECERWRKGCGNCPHLDTYPAIPRDATQGNLKRKRRIFSRSRLHISAPSQWLLSQIPNSILAEAVIGAPRLIPNGVNQTIFAASEQGAARGRLSLPQDRPIIISAANLALSNPYKDWPSLREALRVIGERAQTRVLAFSVGESGPPIEMGKVRVEAVSRVDDPRALADWYRAADVFVQPSAADNHPLTVLESLACGTPVVATAVGGIPEQIHHLDGVPGGVPGGVDIERATGVLVSPGDASGMASCLMSLLENPQRMRRLSTNAAADAKARFDFDRYISDTLDWYEDILAWGSLSQHSIGVPRPHQEM